MKTNLSKMNVLIFKFMIVCIDCFKLFQTISNKNRTCNGPGSQSESENRTWHHALISKKKIVFYTLSERIIRYSRDLSFGCSLPVKVRIFTCICKIFAFVSKYFWKSSNGICICIWKFSKCLYLYLNTFEKGKLYLYLYLKTFKYSESTLIWTHLGLTVRIIVESVLERSVYESPHNNSILN